MKCPNCGYINPDSVLECLRCYRVLNEEMLLETYPPRSRVGNGYRRFRIWRERTSRSLHQSFFRLLQKLRVKPVPGAETTVLFLGLLSLILPGLGQFTAGQKKKGLVIFLTFWVLFGLTFFFHGSPVSQPAMSLAFLVHCYAVADCLRQLPAMQLLLKRLAISAGVGLTVFIFYGLLTALASNYLIILRVNDNLYLPELPAGNYVLVLPGAYLKNEPTRGEVIYFETAGALLPEIQAGELVYFPHGRYLERVIACPGDFFCVTEAHPFVNGAALPEKEWPLHKIQWPHSFQQKLPPEHYLVFLPYHARGLHSTPVVISRSQIRGKVTATWKTWCRRRNL
ncbi:MAG TPA: S26 family signal peptidase [bacterium]|nr:S26 family signal peptidase [bacterium]